MQVESAFLWGISPRFTDYLVIFQSEEPLVHCKFDALKTVVLTMLGSFLKLAHSMAHMCRIDLKEEDRYLSLESIEISVKAKLKVCQKYAGVFHPV